MHTDLPDADITVLMVLQDEEYPVWPGYYDGEVWRKADCGELVESEIVGWVHLHQAADYITSSSL